MDSQLEFEVLLEVDLSPRDEALAVELKDLILIK